VIGVNAIGITDHADSSNLDFIIPRIVSVSKELNKVNEIKTVPGIELTHVPPAQLGPLAEKARSLGAKIIVVHGETIAEPVASGTNSSAMSADIDILAHPGLISDEEVIMAAKKGIFLEISARKGHSLTNGHVARLAKKHGAQLVLNSDAHEPTDLITEKWARQVAFGAGLTAEDFTQMLTNSQSLL